MQKLAYLEEKILAVNKDKHGQRRSQYEFDDEGAFSAQVSSLTRQLRETQKAMRHLEVIIHLNKMFMNLDNQIAF